jgi:hypothetical protein
VGGLRCRYAAWKDGAVESTAATAASCLDATVIEYGSYARTSYVPVAGGVFLVCASATACGVRCCRRLRCMCRSWWRLPLVCATVAFFLVCAAAIFLVLEILV